MLDLYESVKQVMVAAFYKEAQLDRSLIGVEESIQLKFRKELFQAIMELVEKTDNNTLKNGDIRNKIKLISEKTGCSIGQSQKVVNVYLKCYCLLTKKNQKIIEELDCPLDGQVMSKYKGNALKRTSLKNMRDFGSYLAWQEYLKKVGNGVRIRPDIETYDKIRIKRFLS
jgi:hypothetical protein